MPRLPALPTKQCQAMSEETSRRMRFPTFASVRLQIAPPSEHISTMCVFVCACVPSCGFYGAPRSARWKIIPESIYISSHEPELCPNFTLGVQTGCNVGFLKRNQTVTKLAEQMGYYVSVMVPWCGFREKQLLMVGRGDPPGPTGVGKPKNDHFTFKVFFVCVNCLFSYGIYWEIIYYSTE